MVESILTKWCVPLMAYSQVYVLERSLLRIHTRNNRGTLFITLSSLLYQSSHKFCIACCWSKKAFFLKFFYAYHKGNFWFFYVYHNGKLVNLSLVVNVYLSIHRYMPYMQNLYRRLIKSWPTLWYSNQ